MAGSKRKWTKVSSASKRLPNLARFFVVIALSALAVLVLTGVAYYFIVSHQTERYQHQIAEATARGVAENIHGRLDVLAKSLDGIARTPELAALIQAGDSAQLAIEAERLQRQLPGSLRVRLLKSDIETLERNQRPNMGYADLVMVHQAASNPNPTIHSYRTPDEHLAIVRPIMTNDRVSGVILVSFSLQSITQRLAAVSETLKAIELRQGQLRIGYQGHRSVRNTPPTGELPIAGTDWTIRYWSTPADSSDRLRVFAVIGVSGCVLLLVFFLGYRYRIRIFRGDQESIIEAVKDLLKGNGRRVYAVRTNEFDEIITSLFRLVRQTSTKQPAAIADRTKQHKKKQELDLSQPAGYFLAQDGVKVKSEDVLEIPAGVFRADDIGGIVGETLTSEMIETIGQAIGSEAQEHGQQHIIVARDNRPSGRELSEALVRGLRKSGCAVTDLGLAPAPILYFAAQSLDSKTGVMITGSHNPPEYNGLKILMDGDALLGDGIQDIHQRIYQDNLLDGSGTVKEMDLIPDYIGAVVDDVQIGSSIKVVVDAANGVAGMVAPALLKALGCDVVELSSDVAGTTAIQQSDPCQPGDLKALIETVKAESADLGVAIRGVADQLAIVDSEGNVIRPDRQMMLFAADVLSRHPGADIVYDVTCSRHLASEIVKHGGRPVMWKTGGVWIKAKMDETNAMFGGEMTGHMFFKERWFGFDDALYAGARLIEILSMASKPSCSVFAALPRSVNSPKFQISLGHGEPVSFINALIGKANFPNAKITDIDGLRVDFSEGWGLVRAAGVTSSLILMFEADTDKALTKIQMRFKSLMISVDPDIEIPF